MLPSLQNLPVKVSWNWALNRYLPHIWIQTLTCSTHSSCKTHLYPVSLAWLSSTHGRCLDLIWGVRLGVSHETRKGQKLQAQVTGHGETILGWPLTLIFSPEAFQAGETVNYSARLSWISGGQTEPWDKHPPAQHSFPYRRRCTSSLSYSSWKAREFTFTMRQGWNTRQRWKSYVFSL